MRLIRWLVIGMFALTGIYCTLLGSYLAYLGGSKYYVVIGGVLLAVAYGVARRKPWVVKLYGVMLALTLVWSIYEANLTFLSLLPRLAMWLVLAPVIYSVAKDANRDLRTTGLRWVVTPSIATLGVLAVAALSGYTHTGTGTDDRRFLGSTTIDWRHYGNSTKGTRFAELEQINAANAGDLVETWRFRTGVESDFKMTPLQVNGLLYLCTARNVVIAINPDSGEEVWRFDPQIEPPAEHQYARTCRGVSYFESATNEHCAKRIVTGTVDARLIAVDATSGQLCTDFGVDGAVDLRRGLGEHLPDQYYVTSPPLVAGDLLVVGGLVLDNQDLGLPSGVVRAYRATTGDFVWAWDLGNPGVTTEPLAGERYTPGTPNVWTVMSYDPALDLIYAPTGNAAPDYYGGVRREFDDAWSSSIVALAATTGEPVWSYQTVHHDVWDYDLPAQPVLMDVSVDGQRRPAVAVPTKTGDIFLLDRSNGQPIHPAPEQSVPQAPATGEYLAKTQPFSSVPNFRPYRHEKDMWGLTPLDQLACRLEYKLMRYEGLFTPPTTGGSFQFPANFGGFNWGSVSVDADNGLLVAAPMMLGNRTMLVTPEQVAAAGPRAALLLGENHPAVRMDPDAPMPEARAPISGDPYDHANIRYYGLTLPFMSRWPTQVPCFEPPWSQLAVIDMNTKKLLWQRPVGSLKDSGPFGLRLGLPFQVGTPIRAGTLTTRGGLVFLSSTMDSTVRAFDLRTGEVLWQDDLPGSGQATPMSYQSDATGKQYIIVTVPNPSWRYPRDPTTGTYTDSRNAKDGKGGYVIAYALPGN